MNSDWNSHTSFVFRCDDIHGHVTQAPVEPLWVHYHTASPTHVRSSRMLDVPLADSSRQTTGGKERRKEREGEKTIEPIVATSARSRSPATHISHGVLTLPPWYYIGMPYACATNNWLAAIFKMLPHIRNRIWNIHKQHQHQHSPPPDWVCGWTNVHRSTISNKIMQYKWWRCTRSCAAAPDQLLRNRQTFALSKVAVKFVSEMNGVYRPWTWPIVR